MPLFSASSLLWVSLREIWMSPPIYLQIEGVEVLTALHLYFFSTVHCDERPSPSIKLPSSHGRVKSLPSPQISWHLSPFQIESTLAKACFCWVIKIKSLINAASLALYFGSHYYGDDAANDSGAIKPSSKASLAITDEIKRIKIRISVTSYASAVWTKIRNFLRNINASQSCCTSSSNHKSIVTFCTSHLINAIFAILHRISTDKALPCHVWCLIVCHAFSTDSWR